MSVALAILLGTIAATPAQAAPAWVARFNVDKAESGRGIQNATATTDARGDVFAAWESFKSGSSFAQVAMRPAGGAWQAPVTLSAPTEEGFDPLLAVDPKGDAVAVWLGSNASTGARVIQSSEMLAGGGWQAAVDLSTAGQFVTDPTVAVDARGDAVAVWELHGEEWTVQAATKPLGGSWSSPVTIAHTGSQLSSPRVFSDASGTALALWTGRTGGSEVVQSSAKTTGGAWEAPVDISPPGQNVAGGKVGFDAKGDAVAVWQAKIGGAERVESAYRPFGGPWQAAVVLSGQPEAYGPSVSVDPQGEAAASWERYVKGCESIYQVATKPPNGAWQPAVNVSEPGAVAEGAQVSIDATRGVVAVWDHRRCLEGGHEEASIEAAVKPTGNAWQAPTTLTKEDPLAVYNAQLADDPLGDAVAVWTAYDQSTSTGSVQGAAYDAAGPFLEQLSIPASASTGQLVAFSVSPLDAWSALGLSRWTFGDGSFALGTSVTHTYTTSGSYTVSLESEDVLGNKTTSAAAITIGVPPTVGRLRPRHGPESGGTMVRIRGNGFSGATAVRFGDHEAQSFTVVSARKITAVAPAGSGTVDVTVTTPVGTSATGPRDTFAYRRRVARKP